MRQVNRFHVLVSALAIAAALSIGSTSLYGQTEKPSISPSTNESTSHNWTDAQLITSTVSQAWQLSGRNEATFFDMVQQLAAISAKNRDLVLPDNKAAGEKAGQYIKQAAKADHKQLLYIIVDKAVQQVGTPAPADAPAQ